MRFVRLLCVLVSFGTAWFLAPIALRTPPVTHCLRIVTSPPSGLEYCTHAPDWLGAAAFLGMVAAVAIPVIWVVVALCSRSASTPPQA